MKSMRVFFASLFLVGIAGCSHTTSNPAATPATTTHASASAPLVLPIDASVEAQLDVAPNDATRLDILARTACNIDRKLEKLAATDQQNTPEGNSLIGKGNGLSDRYNTLKPKVPSAAGSLGQQEDKFCRGQHPVG